MSTAFHPQTDGASERAIKTVAQVLRSVVSADQKDWVAKVPMTEFALNSAKSSSTGFAPFDLNGSTPRIAFALGTTDVAPGVASFAQQVQNNLLMAHDAILEHRVYQTHYANQRRRSEHPGKREEPTPYRVGNLVYLSTKNLKLPKGRARKLLPKFLGPYKIVEAHQEASTYQLELPEELGEVQEAFGIERQARFVVSMKNPEIASPPGLGLEEELRGHLPDELQELFGGRKWHPADPPAMLDHQGIELLLIGGRLDPNEDLGIELEPQPEDEEQAEVFRDLHLDRSDRAMRPLFEGKWA